jgi:cyanate lyase
MTVISVVVLQSSMDLLKDELGVSNKTCAASVFDGNTVASIEAERMYHVTEEEGQEITTIPVIKMEPNECCVPVVSVTHISYRLYPELSAIVSL